MEQDIKSLSFQAIQDLLNNLTSAKQFAIEQAPDVCRQYVMYGIVSSLAGLVAMIVFMAIAIYVMIKFIKFSKENPYSMDDAGAVFSGVAAAGFIVGACAFSHTAILTLVAPKVYLIQEFSRLIR